MRLRLFLAMWAILALAVGLTVVADDRLDLGGDGGDQIMSGPRDPVPGPDGVATTTTDPASVLPGPGQVRVSGTVTAVRLQGAVLEPRQVATPLTIVSDRGFGNGGEVTGVEVDGRPSSIVWDGGRPFVLSSGAALILDPVAVDLVAEGLRLVLGGAAHALAPGPYRLDTPVAVGTAGIATPRDTVAFTAGPDSLFEARGDAALVLGPSAPRHLVGPGRVQLEGALQLTDAAGPNPATTFLRERAAFDLTFTPAADGTWTVEGLVESPVGG